MFMAVIQAQDPYLAQIHQLVLELVHVFANRPFAVRLPDGTVIPPEPEDRPPAFTFVLNRPAALRRMFMPLSELALGESYLFGDYDIEGELTAAFEFIDRLQWRSQSLGQWLWLGWRLWQLERRQAEQREGDGRFTAYSASGGQYTPERDERSARFHYDVSNDFYRLWLDERMVYSCAYFADPQESFDSAQKRKLDLVCRKLKLQPGERLLDIGCGWGGLVIHAAAEYGADATGITISEAQAQEARARIEAAGLSERCRVEVRHYEQFDSQRSFDKVASIGMFEHVGPKRLAAYFEQVYHLLRPGGLFLLQGASTRVQPAHMRQTVVDRWIERLGRGRAAFYEKYFFPDSHLVDIPTILSTGERASFEVRDVECLREHYALTLHHWLKRLETNYEAAAAEVGEVAYRCWRLLSAYTYYFMDKGLLTEYQSLFARPGEEKG
jgi:cyclopropane-fatty-acyl-phospholipid synthase